MREQGLQALYLDTSTSLAYFTGIQLGPSERLHGAVIPVEGEIAYLSPAFEEPKTRVAIGVNAVRADLLRCCVSCAMPAPRHESRLTIYIHYAASPWSI